MGNRFFCCVAIFLLGADLRKAEITQTPRYLVTKVKQEVTLRCQQNWGHNYMYWYQQEPQKELKLMFYFSYQTMASNESVPQRFKAAPPKNGVLTLPIHTVEAEDSVTYFCSSSKDTALQSHL
uniref:Ig-like domain-containing protein n=1 Tax=Monodelphis domestica TaxID=13616 RepID=A0A5F8H9J5_MONDO